MNNLCNILALCGESDANNFLQYCCFSQLLTIFAMYIAGMLPVQVITFKDNLVELIRLHIVRPLLFLSLTNFYTCIYGRKSQFYYLADNQCFTLSMVLPAPADQLAPGQRVYSFNSTLIFNLK